MIIILAVRSENIRRIDVFEADDVRKFDRLSSHFLKVFQSLLLFKTYSFWFSVHITLHMNGQTHCKINVTYTISVTNSTLNIEPAALFENFKSPYSRRRRKDRDSISRLLLLRRLKSLFHHLSFFGKSSREGPFRKSDTGSFPEHYLEPINSSIKNSL